MLSYIHYNATGNNYSTEKSKVVELELELTKFPEVFIFIRSELFYSSYGWWEPTSKHTTTKISHQLT